MPLSLVLLGALAAGLAGGSRLPPTLATGALALGATAVAAAAFARCVCLQFLSRAYVLLALVAGAAAYGSLAVEHAGRPALVRWLEDRVGAGGWPTRAGRMETPVGVRGRLRRDAAVSSAGVQLTVGVEAVSFGGAWVARAGGAALIVGGDLTGGMVDEWRAGRLVEAAATLRLPDAYRNRGASDTRLALARRGTPVVGSIKSAALVEVVERGPWWDELAAGVRATVRSAMARHVAPRDATAAAVGTAILIGDRAQMAPELERRLQEAGTYHVIAISGGNIAMLAAAVLALLWVAGVRLRGAALTTALVLVAHAWVIGGGASVVRATLMAVTYLGLRAIDQRTAPVNAVAVGAGVMLLASPLDLFDAGFWLTFGATTALLAQAAWWPGRRPTLWWQAPLLVVTGTVAVEIVLTPVSALVFERVTLAGLVANLGAVPAMALVQGAASVCVLADILGADAAATVAGEFTRGAARALVESSRVIDVAPWSTWRVPPPSASLVVSYYGLLIAWWWTAHARRSRGATRAVAVGAAALWLWMVTAPHPRPARERPAPLTVTVLDVGQGDAVLVRFPNGRTLLTDAGGLPGRDTFDVGDRVVGPALRARGVVRLDYLAVTHGDADHAGGAPRVIREFRPQEVWLGVPVPAHALEQAVVSDAHRVRSAVRRLQRGDRLAVGDVDVRVLHPPLADWERRRVRNDDSLVLELRLDAVSILLPGDVGKDAELTLAADLDPAPLVILKAPHHGSASSNSPPLVARTRPAVVLISAGRGNPFGHPAAPVVERYAAAGAVVFRTDRDGEITVSTDGRAVAVRTFTGLRWRQP